jgi:hypothetical protein
MIAEQVVEMMFSAEVAEQRDLVEKQCIVLQTLIDSELEDTSTSFLWCSNKKNIIITDDIFRRKRKFRHVINDDNDDDDDDDDKQDSIRLKFELKSPDTSKSSLPIQTMTFEIDDTDSEPESSVPSNDVIINLSVPFNYVHHIEDKKTKHSVAN